MDGTSKIDYAGIKAVIDTLNADMPNSTSEVKIINDALIELDKISVEHDNYMSSQTKDTVVTASLDDANTKFTDYVGMLRTAIGIYEQVDGGASSPTSYGGTEYTPPATTTPPMEQTQINLNIDTNGDGKPDLNIDINNDGVADLNLDTNGDGKPDLYVDTNGDGTADLNIDSSGQGKPNLNVDTNDDKVADLNVDTNNDGTPDLNVDTNGDGKPDLNIDTNGDGRPDTNVDSDRYEFADTNVDIDNDGVPDQNVVAQNDIMYATVAENPTVANDEFSGTAFSIDNKALDSGVNLLDESTTTGLSTSLNKSSSSGPIETSIKFNPEKKENAKFNVAGFAGIAGLGAAAATTGLILKNKKEDKDEFDDEILDSSDENTDDKKNKLLYGLGIGLAGTGLAAGLSSKDNKVEDEEDYF